jgi:drug/metabolite transporter (DMT)-like permease
MFMRNTHDRRGQIQIYSRGSVAINELTAAALGMASAASWGAGDFCGGVATKRAGSFPVVVGAHLVGAIAFAVLALVSGEARPPLNNLVWCGVAGLAGAVGLLALYRALAVGRMGVAAPVSGVLSAAVPVLAGLLLDVPPGPLQLVGFALALVGVWLVARTDDAHVDVGALGLPIAAGLGFGLFIMIIGRASAGAVFWPLVASRIASLALLSSIGAATGSGIVARPRDWGIVALAGAFDAGGNAFLVAAGHAGRLDVAAVLSSLYPAGTVLLAWSLLKERITRGQLLGLAATLVAIAVITVP